jgi:hypothetical protein
MYLLLLLSWNNLEPPRCHRHSIKSNGSPLSKLIGELDRVFEATANNNTELLLSFADLLTDLNTNSAKAIRSTDS